MKIVQSLLTLLRERRKSDLAKDITCQEQHLSRFVIWALLLK